MTDDLVKRYQLDYHHTRTYAEMAEDCDGDWVKYKDYKDAAVRIEELETKLAKVVEIVEVVETFADRALWKVIKDKVSELKGQDDE